jgi:hypothetical protein
MRYGLSQQCRHNKDENERLHTICNDYKARKVNTRVFVLCCAVLAQPCETGTVAWIAYCR